MGCPTLARPLHLRYPSEMPRYTYHNDFLVSAQYDCGYWVKADNLPEAIDAAEKRRDRNASISVHADCEHAGVSAVAHVGLSLFEMDGKTLEEIYELLDTEVDKYISCRVTHGHWSASRIRSGL